MTSLHRDKCEIAEKRRDRRAEINEKELHGVPLVRVTTISSLLIRAARGSPPAGDRAKFHSEVSKVLIWGDSRATGLHNAAVEGSFPSIHAEIDRSKGPLPMRRLPSDGYVLFET